MVAAVSAEIDSQSQVSIWYGLSVLYEDNGWCDCDNDWLGVVYICGVIC